MKDYNDGFSEHFSFAELTYSKNHSELVAQNREDAKEYFLAGKRLSKLLESIREALGDKPLIVNSGFRNKELNKAVGSKVNSKHMLFEAVDITPSHITTKEAFVMLLQARKSGQLQDLRKVLLEGNWLHCEVAMSPNDYRGFFVSNDGNKTFEKVA